jgi:hypothetical protein
MRFCFNYVGLPPSVRIECPGSPKGDREKNNQPNPSNNPTNQPSNDPTSNHPNQLTNGEYQAQDQSHALASTATYATVITVYLESTLTLVLALDGGPPNR